MQNQNVDLYQGVTPEPESPDLCDPTGACLKDYKKVEEAVGCHWYDQLLAAACDATSCDAGQPGYASCTCACYQTFNCPSIYCKGNLPKPIAK